jgi:hypothetical protein
VGKTAASRHANLFQLCFHPQESQNLSQLTRQ